MSATHDKPEKQERAESPPVASRPTIEELGEWSFPASDPPACWTWDPKPSHGD